MANHGVEWLPDLRQEGPMTRKDGFGIGYVSAWVMIWGTVGSLIDFPLLNADVYVAGSVGQITTFLISALASIILAVVLYPRVLGYGFIISALKLDSESSNSNQ